MHPVHETVSEIEWNERTRRLEVAVRMSVLDEQWIEKNYATDDKLSVWAIAYLKSNFRIDPSERKERQDLKKKELAQTYNWIGRGEEGSHVWWYFEIEPKSGKRPKILEQRMMFERNDNFANRILVLDRVPRVAATLTIQQPILSLEKVANEQHERKANGGNRLDR